MSLVQTLEPVSYYKNIERTKKYKKITDYLKSIKLHSKTCLIDLDEDNYRGKEERYLLGKSILLGKQIGSRSRYGIVYKCKNINKNFRDIPLFTIKIQLNTTSLNREIKILKSLSEFGIKNRIPNLPILYKIIKCPHNSSLQLFDDMYNQNITERGYTMILNELASGDLHTFLDKKYSYYLNDEIWRNTYEQIFISLAILHALGKSHNDAHHGNFLYHKIKKGGCFHYKINGVNYFIKNLGFLWTSWDYGKISSLKNKGSYIYDYMLISIFMRKNNSQKKTLEYKQHELYGKREWGYLYRHVKVPVSIKKFQEKLWKMLGGYHHDTDRYMMRNKISESVLLEELLNKELLFSKKPQGKILSSVSITLN